MWLYKASENTNDVMLVVVVKAKGIVKGSLTCGGGKSATELLWDLFEAVVGQIDFTQFHTL